MNLFKKRDKSEGVPDFEYLDETSIYLDSACQTLRPKPVIDAVVEYFEQYNSCGGRVKYEWGVKVDEKIKETKQQVLDLLGKSDAEYAVAFTLNTTYGINLVLNQLPERFQKIVTSQREHNSVFLPTMATAKRLNIPRKVLSRSTDGSLEYESTDLSGAVVILNSVSNIDGRKLLNLKKLTNDVHEAGGVILVDAAQGMSHDRELLISSDFDALFFSGHKFYGPSLGVIVIKRSLLSALDIRFIGGGTVEDVELENYTLVSSHDDIAGRLEIGLQDFSGIIGLGAAMKWFEKYKPEGNDKDLHQRKLSNSLFEKLSQIPSVKLVNASASPIVSFYSDKIDAHRLAIYLSSQGIMVRSGYFCCHYYLKNLKNYPPLVRVSIGMHNTEKQIEKFVDILTSVLNNVK